MQSVIVHCLLLTLFFIVQPLMIAREGYFSETHTVITEDGYVLEMHRIPFGKNAPGNEQGVFKPPVYLQHGLLCSSADWVMGIAAKSLGMKPLTRNF